MSSQNGKHRAHRALQELLRAVFFVNDADETYDECGDRRENTQPDQMTARVETAGNPLTTRIRRSSFPEAESADSSVRRTNRRPWWNWQTHQF